ncbi:MAG TPA: hypothetical protein VFA04_18815 [Bryobacteraceae bacterium]|nr:hypothetical protein [Bryobacteraceae bacterium]
MTSTMYWTTPGVWLRSESAFMTDPNDLRRPLAELLQSIEGRQTDQAASQARALAAELADTFAPPDPLGREYRPAPVRFSGLRHAVLRDIKSAERHITEGNWSLAEKALRSALQLLPEQHKSHRPQSRSVAN